MNWEILTPIIMALGFVSTTYINNKNRAVSAQGDVITIYKEQIGAQQLKIDSMEARIVEQGNQISKLEQANREKDTKLSEYLLIFQGRDKQSVDLMKIVQGNAEMIKAINADMHALHNHILSAPKPAIGELNIRP